MQSAPQESVHDWAYQDWLKEVNRRCFATFGIGYRDLPDVLLTRDAFASGITAKTFFEEDVMRVAREEFGDLVDALDEESP